MVLEYYSPTQLDSYFNYYNRKDYSYLIHYFTSKSYSFTRTQQNYFNNLDYKVYHNFRNCFKTIHKHIVIMAQTHLYFAIQLMSMFIN